MRESLPAWLLFELRPVSCRRRGAAAIPLESYRAALAVEANSLALSRILTAWCSYTTLRDSQRSLNHLRELSLQHDGRRSLRWPRAVDAAAPAHDLRLRSKLTWNVAMKGKGHGPTFYCRSRSAIHGGRPVVTRLTRTMAFVEVTQSPSVPGSAGTSGDDMPDDSAVTRAPH